MEEETYNNSKSASLPPELYSNIKTLLNKKPAGYDFNELAKLYFQEFKTFVYPDKYGFKNWEDILTQPELSSYCEIFNCGLNVRIKSLDAGRSSQRPHPPSMIPSPSGMAQTNGSQPGVFGNPPFVEKREIHSSASSQASSGKRNSHINDDPDSKRQAMDVDAASESTDTWMTDVTHVSILPHNLSRLTREKNKIQWIPREAGLVPLTFSTLIMERVIAPDVPAMFIDCTYCERQVLEMLMDVKGQIKRVSADKFATIRNKYNEFEFERGAIFQHGAAIKLANIDALMGHALSNPKGPDGANLVGPNELLYFADVCGGPGGYVEYILWKKKWEAKGFGINPRGKTDYNFIQAEHFPRESFEPFYGENGTEGTGDIMKPYNLARFTSFIRDSTEGRGLHFLVASGGDRNDYVDEDQKEIRCKYIFMAELLCALQTVRAGGHYVTRVYDMYTPFTVGLLYLMYRTFEQVAVFKPESSLPASAEKYIFCKWRKSDSQVKEISNYLSECHKIDWLTKRNQRSRGNEEPADIVHLISRERIKESYGFCNYVLRVNNELGRRQFGETTSLIHRIKNEDEMRYVEERLREISAKCLDLWGIPKTTRQKPKYAKASTPDLRAKKLILPYSFDFFQTSELSGESELTIISLQEDIIRPKEWVFMPIGRHMRGFFLCLGGSNIYHFGGAKWNEVHEKIELMNNTLVYADLVDEIKVNGSMQSITTGFHIIDALVLGGTDVRYLPANERYDLIAKYSRSMSKESRNDLATIRVKHQYELKYFNKFMSKVTEFEGIRTRDGEPGTKFVAPVQLHQDQGSVYVPAGILFVKAFKENFAPADVRFCLSNRLFWRWSPESDLKVPGAKVDTPAEVDDDMDEEKKNRASTGDILRHLSSCGNVDAV